MFIKSIINRVLLDPNFELKIKKIRDLKIDQLS